jgi:hypothetical protein
VGLWLLCCMYCTVLYLEDAVELVRGVVVEEEGQSRADSPHRVPVPGRQPCINSIPFHSTHQTISMLLLLLVVVKVSNR